MQDSSVNKENKVTRRAEQNNSWAEYSRLVLKELETLAAGMDKLNIEMQTIKKELAIIKDREDKVEKILEWKERLSEVVSASQLSEMTKDVAALKDFKTKAITIFIVVQSIISLAFVVLNYLK